MLEKINIKILLQKKLKINQVQVIKIQIQFSMIYLRKKTILLALIFCACLQMVNSFRYNGKAITLEIQQNITQLLKKSFILNGKDNLKNAAFIQKNLVNIYSGNFNVIILYNEENYQYLNYSMNGEWWIHWSQANPYIKEAIYGIQKVEQKYYPQEQIITESWQTNIFGKGITDLQQQIIKNIMTIDHQPVQLQQLLATYISPGNWNVKRGIWCTYFAINAKQNKWFNYPQYSKVSYFVYFAYLS